MYTNNFTRSQKLLGLSSQYFLKQLLEYLRMTQKWTEINTKYTSSNCTNGESFCQTNDAQAVIINKQYSHKKHEN